MIERQCIVVKKYIDGDIILPSCQEMVDEFEKNINDLKKNNEIRNYFLVTSNKG